MSSDEHIRKLEETKAKLDSAPQNMRAAELHKLRLEASQRIEGHLADLLILKQKEDKRRKEEQHTHLTLGLIAGIVLLSFIAGIYYAGPLDSGITGFVVKQDASYQVIDEEVTARLEKVIEGTNITSLQVSGTLEGKGAVIKLVTGNGELIVANLTNKEYGQEIVLSTGKKEYLIGETVTIRLAPEEYSTSLYIFDAQEAKESTGGEYLASKPGEYKAVALVATLSDIVRLEVAFKVIAGQAESADATINETNSTANETIGPKQPISGEDYRNEARHLLSAGKVEFEDLCVDSCSMPAATRPLLVVEPAEGSRVTLRRLLINSEKANYAPVQAQAVPDITIQAGKAKAIDLKRYFTDPEGDLITLEISQTPGVYSAITGQELVLSSDTMGRHPARLYATDASSMTTSNDFYIIVVERLSEEQASPAAPAIDTIQQAVQQEPPAQAVLQSDCTGPLKERPSICFEGEENKYFKEIVSTLDDKAESQVGRFTRFGNMIIRGVLVENSTGTPKPNDFKISYTERADFEDVKTITAWIESESGDLHLRGSLHEEIQTLEPGQFNTYNINNKLGITLAYFDEKTGDLYLRGNLVQLGKV